VSLVLLSLDAHSKIATNKIATNKLPVNGVSLNGVSLHGADQILNLRSLAQAPLVKAN
jgi:hypothetical protein